MLGLIAGVKERNDMVLEIMLINNRIMLLESRDFAVPTAFGTSAYGNLENVNQKHIS
jgi:hypothetical protein